MSLQITRSALAIGEHAPVYAASGRRDGGFPEHRHDFVELALIRGGGGVHRSQRGRLRLAAGDLLVLRPGAWHAYEDCAGLRICDCAVAPDVFERELAFLAGHPACAALLWAGPMAPDAGGVHHVRLPAEAAAEAADAIDDLRRLYRGAGDRRLPQTAHLLRLLAAAARHEAAPQAAPPPPACVLEAMRALAADPARPWSSRALAARLGVSQPHLIRRFTAAVGLPPLAYLARLRAERACALLTRGDASISAIAEAVGWPEAFHFARRFKAHTGMSASDYRRRFRVDGVRSEVQQDRST